jgi:hypothetical protein
MAADEIYLISSLLWWLVSDRRKTPHNLSRGGASASNRLQTLKASEKYAINADRIRNMSYGSRRYYHFATKGATKFVLGVVST